MNIMVIWNGEARKQLSETNPGWYTGLRQSIPEAKWNLNPCPPTTTSATIPTLTRAFKSKRDDNTPTRMACSSQLAHTSLSPTADHHLQLKVPDWRKWAYTDGSCLTSFSPQRIGAGVYIPSSNTSIYVNSGGVGMINTITRAELTGIAAALSSSYTSIATDSACSLSQIGKQLSSPETQRKHKHSKLLKQIAYREVSNTYPLLQGESTHWRDWQ